MSDVAIGVEGLGKRYRIGEAQRYNALRDSLARILSGSWLRLRPSPGEPNGREETFWALKDLSFEIQRGDVVGIVGRNGAGKSTLLKILSRITEPTEGVARIRGRVGSLLEVGTGFHPELTGRENITLNGAILGMGRREIARKFDAIVSFAEVERFLDTPVKHYSSGMYVRLAFGVAAHLEPDILLVDEVLAVGDAAFQKKCLGKMDAVAREGRTVLFVSHNMGAVGRLCQRGVLLHEGRVEAEGPMADVIERYMARMLGGAAEVRYAPDDGKVLQILRVRLLDYEGRPSRQLDRIQPFRVAIDYCSRQRTEGAHLALMLDRADGTPVWHSVDTDSAPDGIIERTEGTFRAIAEFPAGILNAGTYYLRLGLARYGGQVYDYREPLSFQLLDNGTFASLGASGKQRTGVIGLPVQWTMEAMARS